jgi:hypothetical protein
MTWESYVQGGTKLTFSTGPDGPVEILFTGPLKIFTGSPFSNELSNLYSVILPRQFQWDHEKTMHY